jgi:hypothetical protein
MPPDKSRQGAQVNRAMGSFLSEAGLATEAGCSLTVVRSWAPVIVRDKPRLQWVSTLEVISVDPSPDQTADCSRERLLRQAVMPCIMPQDGCLADLGQLQSLVHRDLWQDCVKRCRHHKLCFLMETRPPAKCLSAVRVASRAVH